MMSDTEILDKLTGIFRAVLSDADIVLAPETTPMDIPKWDSFRYIDIILQVEAAFGVRIRSREANKLRNVGEMVALIRDKRAGA